MKVEGANIADGLLQIDLAREVPESQKPRTIEIKADRSSGAKAISGSRDSEKSAD